MAMTIGSTIKEAKQRISVNEFQTWIRYREKFGPMNPVRRYDVGPAMLASLISRVHGGKAKPLDFIAFGKDPEEDTVVDADGFLKALAGTGRMKRGR